jgi:hypothetical protein
MALEFRELARCQDDKPIEQNYRDFLVVDIQAVPVR